MFFHLLFKITATAKIKPAAQFDGAPRGEAAAAQSFF